MRSTLLPLLLLSLGFPLGAQVAPRGPLAGDSTLVDRVIAVVGDSVILAGQIQEEMLLAEAMGRPVTAEEVLETLVNVQLVLQAAGRDSTLVPDETEVTRRVDLQIERARERFATQAAFEEALAQQGMTMGSYRDQLRATFRTQLLQTTYLQRQLQSAASVAVTEEEMRAVFEQRRGELQQRPETYSVQQVLIRAGASDSAWARAEELADSLHVVLIAGADFETLAREHSQDPGSAAQGGDLGWVPRGQMVPEFEQAVFSLRDQVVSPPVRTEYGFHIIRVERSRPGEKRVRHILVRPETTAEALAETRALAEDVARRLREGEDARALARAHGDDDFPAEFTLAPSQPGSIPPVFVQNVTGAQPGQVIGPFEVDLGRPYFAVLKVTDVRPAGEYVFEDVRESLRAQLLQEKQEERIYQSLRERTHVEIRN